jgi:ketosteroid isomerase-like protein
MRIHLPLTALALLAACTPAASPTPSSPAPATVAVASSDACPVAPVPSDLAPTRNAYIAAWQGTDADAVARYFLDDARVQTDDETLTGRATITSGWISEDIGKLSDLRLTARSVSQSGADITESGAMTLKFHHDDGSVTGEGGTYTHVWTRQPDGSWRLREARLHRGRADRC